MYPPKSNMNRSQRGTFISVQSTYKFTKKYEFSMSYCVTFARAKYTTKRKFGDEPAQKQLLIPFQVAMRSLDLWGQYFVNFIHFFPVFFYFSDV